LGGVALDDRTADLVQVQLLGRELIRQRCQRGGFVCIGELSDTFGGEICKGLLRHFALNTAHVVRSEVVIAAIALRLLPLSRTPNGELGAPQATHRCGIHCYNACVRSAGSVCISVGLLSPRTIPRTLAGRTC
jgi:hypothetical protein